MGTTRDKSTYSSDRGPHLVTNAKEPMSSWWWLLLGKGKYLKVSGQMEQYIFHQPCDFPEIAPGSHFPSFSPPFGVTVPGGKGRYNLPRQMWPSTKEQTKIGEVFLKNMCFSYWGDGKVKVNLTLSEHQLLCLSKRPVTNQQKNRFSTALVLVLWILSLTLVMEEIPNNHLGCMTPCK